MRSAASGSAYLKRLTEALLVQVVLIDFQTYFDLPRDDMAQMRQEDKTWVANEVARKVEASEKSLRELLKGEIEIVLRQATERPKRSTGLNFLFFLREWGLLAASITGAFALLGLAGSGYYYAFNRVDREARFEQSTTDTLASINQHLIKIDKEFSKEQLSNLTLVPSADFKNYVPQLKASIQKVRDQKQSVPDSVIENIQRKLLSTDKEAKDYWSAVAELVSYRSEASNNLPSGRDNLSNCVDSKPNSYHYTTNGLGQVDKFYNAYYEHCKFTIDSAEEASKVNYYLQNGFPWLEFRHCLIVYNGGPIKVQTETSIKSMRLAMAGVTNPAVVSYNGPSVYFTNCEFELAVQDKIPNRPSAEGLLEALLKKEDQSSPVSLTGDPLAFSSIEN